ncbi:hypothetical protein GDO81_013609 [Engystomops pustulosus]|uniref:Uncharacterized protein n=1 Tax=Engystomops pustulosus TaxID=76066 RepID=A0AAV7B4N6_ENGPU|nr:hypothetical protein GDO81_013609 [Engystomops pustulosus]
MQVLRQRCNLGRPYGTIAPELENSKTKKFSTRELPNAFKLIETTMEKLEQDPDRERFIKVYCIITKDVIRLFRIRKKSSVQTSLDAYFKKPTPAADLDSDSIIPAPSSPVVLYSLYKMFQHLDA